MSQWRSGDSCPAGALASTQVKGSGSAEGSRTGSFSRMSLLTGSTNRPVEKRPGWRRNRVLFRDESQRHEDSGSESRKPVGRDSVEPISNPHRGGRGVGSRRAQACSNGELNFSTMSEDTLKSDWRRQGQEAYLPGVSLTLRQYSSGKTDHDHCEFCAKKFSVAENDLREGYCTDDEYRWICLSCFRDFKDSFRWTTSTIETPT